MLGKGKYELLPVYDKKKKKILEPQRLEKRIKDHETKPTKDPELQVRGVAPAIAEGRRYDTPRARFRDRKVSGRHSREPIHGELLAVRRRPVHDSAHDFEPTSATGATARMVAA